MFTDNAERSGLYLKLFKLVFGSVSLLAAENEQMLKVRTYPVRVRVRVLVLSFILLIYSACSFWRCFESSIVTRGRLLTSYPNIVLYFADIT